MIASRFKSVGLAVAVGFAALGCYLVSQRVASERAGVEALDRRIIMARLDIRKLETELQTRSRLPTLEGWNREVWGLSAPTASQYLHGEVQLASLRMQDSEARVIQVAVAAEAARAATQDMPREQGRGGAREAERQDEGQPMLRHANYVKPSDASFDPEPRRVALLDDGLLADLKQAAHREKSTKSSAR